MVTHLPSVFMAGVGCNQFRYVLVDGEYIEIAVNQYGEAADDKMNHYLDYYADSQVSSGWMSAAYRLYKDSKDDSRNDSKDESTIVVVDPDDTSPQTSTSTATLILPPQASETTAPAASSKVTATCTSDRCRARSRSR